LGTVIDEYGANGHVGRLANRYIAIVYGSLGSVKLSEYGAHALPFFSDDIF